MQRSRAPGHRQFVLLHPVGSNIESLPSSESEVETKLIITPLDFAECTGQLHILWNAFAFLRTLLPPFSSKMSCWLHF